MNVGDKVMWLCEEALRDNTQIYTIVSIEDGAYYLDDGVYYFIEGIDTDWFSVTNFLNRRIL